MKYIKCKQKKYTHKPEIKIHKFKKVIPEYVHNRHNQYRALHVLSDTHFTPDTDYRAKPW